MDVREDTKPLEIEPRRGRPNLPWYSLPRHYFDILLNATLLKNTENVDLPLEKKLSNLRSSSLFFMFVDLTTIVGSIVLCANYIAETYTSTYNNQIYYRRSELVFVTFFMIDFLMSWLTSSTIVVLFSKWTTYVDIFTIIPILVEYGLRGQKFNSLSISAASRIFRFVRIFNLFRLRKTVKRFSHLSAFDLQLTEISLTLISLILISAAVIEVFENDWKEYFFYDCLYSTERTNFQPSCTPDAPASNSCDCSLHNCYAEYDRFDLDGQPSRVRCVSLPFFECIYFIVVTISTVGYGDFVSSYTGSRVVICLLLIAIVLVLPGQINELSRMMSRTSKYRKRFKPSSEQSHVIVTAKRINKEKIEAFFREFYCASRDAMTGHQYYTVIVSSDEPSEDIVEFLNSPIVGDKMIYRLGSISSVDDMRSISASKALALFYLCDNLYVNKDAVNLDNEMAMHLMSFRNLAPQVDILAEVYLGKSWKEMYGADVDILLNLSEYKTAIMTRNALCPGFSTLIESMMTTVSHSRTKMVWLQEYTNGCMKKVYAIKMPNLLMQNVFYKYSVLVELLYIKLAVICIGVCDQYQEDIILNPTDLEIRQFLESTGKKTVVESGAKLFFEKYSYVLVLADSEKKARTVNDLDHNPSMIFDAIKKLHESECSFSVDFEQTSSERRENGERMHALEMLELPQKSLSTSLGDMLMNMTNVVDEEMPASVIEQRDSIIKRTMNIESMYKIDRYAMAHNDSAHFKRPSSITIIEDASKLTDHIVVIGLNRELYYLALREFRRPLIVKNFMHPILFFGEISPLEHQHPEETEEVYYIQGSYKDKNDLGKLNLRSAFSIIVFVDEIMGSHADLHSSSVDTILFNLYMTITSLIKNRSKVFLCMELCTGDSLSAINLKVTRDIARNDTYKVNSRESIGVETEQKFLVKGSRMKAKKKKIWDKVYDLKLRNILYPDYADQFWDFSERPTALPIYAAGKAFVAQGFDSLLLQSFFTNHAAKLFEILVTGQKYQTIFSVPVPTIFIGRTCYDLYRAFVNRNILIIGIYRTGHEVQSIEDLERLNCLPHVYVGPEPTTIMCLGDSLFVFSHPDLISDVLNEFSSSRGTSMFSNSSDTTANYKQQGGGARSTRNVLHKESEINLSKL